MGIKFQCPACKAVRAANERLMGREIHCPACGGLLQLPSHEQIETARRQREVEQQEDRQRERQLNRVLAQASSSTLFPGLESGMRDAIDPDATEERLSAEERALAAASTNFLRPKRPQGEDMDMTPMVDVTFLLLIFFMITASFSVQKAIQRPAELKDQPSQNTIIDPEKDKDTVTVQVDEFNAYNVLTADGDSPAGSKQDLIIALSDAHESASRPSKLVIEAHENCIHAAVVAALDAGREANFESFEVTTVEQFD